MINLVLFQITPILFGRQRNLSVLIKVRRVHYGEMSKAPTTISETNFNCTHYEVFILFFTDGFGNSKFAQIPSILVDFSIAVFYLVCNLHLISCSLSLFSMFLGTVPKVPTKNGITINFMFHTWNKLLLILFCSLENSSPQHWLMVIHWNLNHRNCPHDSPQYSSRSQQCCRLNGLNSSADFQPYNSLPKPLGTKCTNYNWYYRDGFFFIF